MDYFTKWPEPYAISNQEASMVAEALVINFFCRFSVPQELQSDQGHIFFFIASGLGLSPLYCGHFWPIVPGPDDT
jgi:hypothetical protein